MKPGKKARPRSYQEILRLVFTFLAAVFIIIAIFSLFNSFTILNPPRRLPALTPADYNMSYEAVSFYSPEGLKLKGWLIPNEQSDSLIIVCHGHGANKGDVLPEAKFLHDGGYEILLFDFRAHGESRESIATLGWLETSDLKAAVEYAKNRTSPGNIGVIGFSMGGATAITTAGQTSDIKAVVADSAFADRSRLISKAAGLPPPLSYFTVFFAEIQGMNRRENLPIDYVDKISPSALFIIQGDRDHLVDAEDAYLLYNKAGEPKELWLVENTPHVGAHLTQEEEYERRVLEFFGTYL